MGLQRQYAVGIGIVLLAVGIIGFFTQKILIFDVNTLHNIVHLATGVLGIIAGLAAGGEYARTYNVIFGIIYGIVTLLGLLQVTQIIDLLRLNPADNFLHLVITLASLGIGFGAHE